MLASSLVALTLLLSEESDKNVDIEWKKNESNPVVTMGKPGDFDHFNIFAPMVARDGDGYKMWYSAGPNRKYTDYQIGLATSADGVKWKKTGPILPLGERDNCHLTMTVLRSADGQLLRADGLHKMWFVGNRANDLEYATSRDGVHWEKYAQNPVARGIYAPTIIKDGETYKMWFTFGPYENFKIGYATSDDGIHWKKHEGAILSGERGWENESILYPFVLKDGDVYRMWYTGGAPSGWTYIGEATSDDGVNWLKSPRNPVVSPTKKKGSGWDSVYTSCASVLKMPNGRWRMYYAGRKDAVHKYYAIGFAEK